MVTTANGAYQANHDVIFDGESYHAVGDTDKRFRTLILKYSKDGNRIVIYGD